MRAAEGGQKVVERIFVGQVDGGKLDGGKLETPFEFVAAQQVIVAQRKIEEISRRDAGRIGIVISDPGAGICRSVNPY
jgi:hypothetical protein